MFSRGIQILLTRSIRYELPKQIRKACLFNSSNFFFSRFGSREKKLEDLNKQYQQQQKKFNVSQMMITQIKIIKTKESIHSKEFYPQFVQDYINLADILIQKAEFEEVYVLLNDGIKHFTKMKNSTNPQLEAQNSTNANTIATLNQNMLFLKIWMCRGILADQTREGEEILEEIEELYKLAKEQNEILNVKYIESAMYFKAGSYQESCKIAMSCIEEMSLIIKQSDLISKQDNAAILKKDEVEQKQEEKLENESKSKIKLMIDFVIVAMQCKLQQGDVQGSQQLISFAQQLFQSTSKIDVSQQIKIQELSSEVSGMNGDLIKQQSIIQYLRETVDNKFSENVHNMITIARIHYQLSDHYHHINNTLQFNQALDITFQKMQMTSKIEFDLIWKALHLKGVQLCQLGEFSSAEKIFLTNKREMELKNKTHLRLYFETILHISVTNFISQNNQEATSFLKLAKESISKNREFGQSSSLYMDAKLIDGLYLMNIHSSAEEEQKNNQTALLLIREACMYFRKNGGSQMWLRVLCLNLLKEHLRRKQLFSEILYINIVLEQIYFKPRQFANDESLLQAYKENTKQTELLNNMLATSGQSQK